MQTKGETFFVKGTAMKRNDDRKKDPRGNEQQGTSMGRGDADDWKMERGTRKHDWGTKRSSTVGGTGASSVVTG